MESKIYIGKNGIGKSKELQKFFKSNEKNSLLLKYSEKGNAPNSNVIDRKNELLVNFQNFLNELFSFSSLVEASKLNEKDQIAFNEINSKLKSNEELDKMWNRTIKNPNLGFLNREGKNKIEKLIISKKDEKKLVVRKQMYEFDFGQWKSSTTQGIKNYGTGSLVYFQITFLFNHIDLIEPNEKKYLIIDEPELFLHPSWKRKIGFMLREIGQKMNVVVASHSSEFLGAFYSNDNTKVFSRKKHKDKWMKIEFKEPYQFTSLKEYFEALMADKIFIVEGGNDFKLVDYILNFYHLKISKHIYIMIALGKSKIQSKIHILKSIKKSENGQSIFQDEDIFIIFDKDSSRKDQKVEGKETHDSINKKLVNNKCKAFFEENLEKYFEVPKKNKWDIETFFSEEKNKQKLKEFVDEFKVKSFLEIEKKQDK